jgi:hypothetical protein
VTLNAEDNNFYYDGSVTFTYTINPTLKHNLGEFFDGASTQYNMSMNYHDIALIGNNNQLGHYY